MQNEKFDLRVHSVGAIIGHIETGDYVIPEIQRPFVWSKAQVRDLIDSLYNGYPTGYIITWKNPDVKTKDGSIASGRTILIDGQQRITALMAAIVGLEVLNEDFTKERIKIAFNPLATSSDKYFAVQDASHLKDKKWIPDISIVFEPGFNSYSFITDYCDNNPGIVPDWFNNVLQKLQNIKNRQIGVIELMASLDIEEVTEIFIRINSKGTSLSQSDFVMSKMASDAVHGGNTLRKVVDYFCHLAVKPDFYNMMLFDKEFVDTQYANKIKWLANDSEDIFDPTYSDLLRVAFMYSFDRSRLAELVSLLAGRDFETKDFKEDIVVESYEKIRRGIEKFINEYNFKQFVIAIKGAGFNSNKLLNSQMTLDFAYMLYLKLSEDDAISSSQVKRYVQKWFVLSTLTGRYVGSPESMMARDIRVIKEKGFISFFEEVQASELSDTFWHISLPQKLETSSTNSPAFNIFIAAQIRQNSNSLLMNGTMISDLVNIAGDVHHIFPKAYLKKHGVTLKGKYNQIANYIYLDTQVNKAVNDDAPNVYFQKVQAQFNTGNAILGNIMSQESLETNLNENAIPLDVINMTVDDYDDFLQERRIKMAMFIERYYKSI